MLRLKIEQAQRRATGDRSGRKYTEKYVSICPLGQFLTILERPQTHRKRFFFFKHQLFFLIDLFVALSLAKKYVSMVKIVTFGLLGPILPFSKVPPKLIKNGNFQK